NSAAFSADGTLLVLWGYTGQIRLWDVAGGKEVRQIAVPQGQFVQTFALSPDNKLLAIDVQKNQERKRFITLWDVGTGKQVGQMGEPKDIGQRYVLPTLTFSADGRTLASASGEATDRGINLWEVSSGKLRRQLPGHQRETIALAFAPDSKTLASGSNDSSALIWNVAGLDPKEQPPDKLTEKDLADLDADLAGADAAKAFRAIG